MALFQKKPSVENSKPIYTLGANKQLLIVGLGNVGNEYDGTRHNIGFNCVDALAESQEFGDWTNKNDLKCLVAMSQLGETRVILCKPTTMMNLSGEAVQAISHFYKFDSSQLVVVHDELDIPFGQIRTRLGGSDAGHNGVKSLIQHLGPDFGRVRIGVGPKTPRTYLPAGRQVDSADFVLAKFATEEESQLKNLFQESNAILTECIHGGALPAETRNFLV